MIGSFAAFLFPIPDDRFSIQHDLRAAIIGNRSRPWGIIVSTERVVLRLKRPLRRDLFFGYDVDTARYQRAPHTPGNGFLDVGPNNLGLRAVTGSALVGIETSLRQAHGEEEPPLTPYELNQLMYAQAHCRARRRRKIRRFVTTVVIVGAVWGGNALYQSHRESDFKQRCTAAGGDSAFLVEGEFSNFDFSGTCMGAAGILFTE